MNGPAPKHPDEMDIALEEDRPLNRWDRCEFCGAEGTRLGVLYHIATEHMEELKRCLKWQQAGVVFK